LGSESSSNIDPATFITNVWLWMLHRILLPWRQLQSNGIAVSMCVYMFETELNDLNKIAVVTSLVCRWTGSINNLSHSYEIVNEPWGAIWKPVAATHSFLNESVGLGETKSAFSLSNFTWVNECKKSHSIQIDHLWPPHI
jgi:hypothetical protein